LIVARSTASAATSRVFPGFTGSQKEEENQAQFEGDWLQSGFEVSFQGEARGWEDKSEEKPDEQLYPKNFCEFLVIAEFFVY
jgi:hypothetical protein